MGVPFSLVFYSRQPRRRRRCRSTALARWRKAVCPHVWPHGGHITLCVCVCVCVCVCDINTRRRKVTHTPRPCFHTRRPLSGNVCACGFCVRTVHRRACVRACACACVCHDSSYSWMGRGEEGLDGSLPTTPHLSQSCSLFLKHLLSPATTLIKYVME